MKKKVLDVLGRKSRLKWKSSLRIPVVDSLRPPGFFRLSPHSTAVAASAGGGGVRGPAPVCLCCRGVCGGRA